MIIRIIQIWIFLGIVAVMLIQFRKDHKLITSDIATIFYAGGNYLFMFVSAIILYIILPITIPFTIIHIIKNLR
jgi:hypothetical protein